MRLSNFYTRPLMSNTNAKRNGFVKSFLVAGIMLALSPMVANAQVSPTPNYGTLQGPYIVCDNQPIDISDWLTVTDPDLGETITWTLISADGGTISGDGATAPAGTSASVPTGMTFTPIPGATSGSFAFNVTDDGGGSVVIVANLNINSGPSVILTTPTVAVCPGVTNVVIPFTGLTNVGPDTMTFSYTGGVQSWNVPENVTSIKFDLTGAGGGNDNFSGAPNPGKGGRITGTLSVAPLTPLNVFIGGKGSDGSPSGAAGGYNGGGDAFNYSFGCGGAGGGATDIRIGGMTLANRKVVAGGGGGNGADGVMPIIPFAGGNGGGTIGANGAINNGGTAARGGSQSVGGAPATYPPRIPGAFGFAGEGGDASTEGISGAGGGGYYGGGGGIWTGGGGGSSYADGTSTFSVAHTQGVNAGDGTATFYFTHPGTYTIIWDSVTVGGARDAGFESVANVVLPTNGEFNVAIPAGVASGTYHGELFIDNIHCLSVPYPITVTVKPKPTVDNPGDIIVCHGDETGDITFLGSEPASGYFWTTDNFDIGVVSTSPGHIASFPTVNGTDIPVSATFTVTPFGDGCFGDPEVFHIIDNPRPMLNSVATPPAVCNNTFFDYLPTSLTPGTSFDWSRDLVTGIANDAETGSGNPHEILVNTTTDPIAVTYVYTLTANGCTNTQNVTVIVNPTPVLTSEHTPAALCNNASFDYMPMSSTGGASIMWSRPVVSGISNAAASGSAGISEVLMNTTTTPKTVTYVMTLSIGGCSYTENVVVTVNPPLTLTSATAISPTCDGLLFHYEPTTMISGATINWTRPDITGISNPASSGTGNIDETLENTTPDPIVVTYTYTLAAFGCTKNQNVTITVNPRPMLSTSLTPGDICTNTLFSYAPASATAGTTFTWARDNQPGITNPAILSSGSVNEILVNSTDTTIPVKYLYTSFANGCANAETVIVNVNPLPRISNDISSLAVCDSALFSFVPASVTPGATFSWTRAYEAGIGNINGAGTGNPNERLNNTTYITVPVTYVYTITANGCSNSQNVIVQVRPSAVLTSNTATVCSAAPFNYVPVSYTTGASFAWSRTASAGITPPSKSGTGNIVDTLTQSTSAPVVVVYDMDLTIFGCTNAQKVNVTVNPAPSVAVIGTHPAVDLCNNTVGMNFGVDVPAPTGFTYSWSGSNADLVSTGNNGQFALFNFSNPGTAVVTVTTHNSSTTCTSNSSFSVNVGAGVAQQLNVIYFDGQFICQQTEQSSYQWGYDDAATLDSVVLDGETNQNYANAYPDFINRYYWVITSRNGCIQKTYYNKPTGVADVNNADAGLKVFPNPASQYINVEVTGNVKGNITMDVFNMLGQQVQNVTATNGKAQISIADLPAGAYIVDCYSDGLKVAAARFIKN
jgi:hypothetical protein